MYLRIVASLVISVATGTPQLRAATTPVLTGAVPSIVQTCAGCHGNQGLGGGVYPRLAGQPEGYLQQQLRDFRSGIRSNGLMQPVAKGLSDADITAAAHYFSGITAPFETAKQSVSATELRRGHTLVTVGDWQKDAPACARCHGLDLGGVAPGIPMLAGQSPRYLLARLQTFKDTDSATLSATDMSHASKGLSDADLRAVTAYIAQLKPGETLTAVRPPHDAAYKFIAQQPDKFEPPPESAIPTGPDGDMIWRGLLIFEHTKHEASHYVGNDLNCASCHLDRGRRANAAPMWAAYVAYPKYRNKNHQVNTLEERIQGCFRFSMNGNPPPADSPEMDALVSYFHWLATGLPVGITPKGAGYPKLKPPAKPVNLQRGTTVYAASCALCHGDDGEGREARGQPVFLPLWGARSFNWGAGMERISTAAEFIKANMPYGAGNTLTDQQAWDVAAFVVSHARPQDPRYTGSIEATRKKFHANDSYYGRMVNGHLLGSPDKPHDESSND